jgi:hypothetical protein
MDEYELKQIFMDFIQFVHDELQTHGWRNRMELLLGEQITDMSGYRMNKTFTEMVEEENGDIEWVMIIIFKEIALEEYWFKSWFEKIYPEKEWSWDLRDDFRSFLYSLSFNSLMEIVENDFCMK